MESHWFLSHTAKTSAYLPNGSERRDYDFLRSGLFLFCSAIFRCSPSLRSVSFFAWSRSLWFCSSSLR